MTSSSRILELDKLPTPLKRVLPGSNASILLENWTYIIKPDKDNRYPWLERTIPAGFVWDGASKPFKNKAYFVLPSCHWKLDVPTLEHDDMCANREWFAARGIDSIHAARHFRRRMEEYGVNDDGINDVWEMYMAVRHFGPQWSAT